MEYLSIERKKVKGSCSMGLFSAFSPNNMNPHTHAHTQHIFKTTQLLYAFYTAPVERKRLFPSVAVKSLIVIIIIQKCEPPSMKTVIIKET